MSATALFGERQPFERYQSVVDRQMFGQPPPGFDPTKAPSEVSAKDERAKEQELTKEQEQVKSAIHFSVINVTPAGATAVGFTDNSEPKNPKHYYLKVGESRDGWTVKEADPLAATMTIAKGEVEVSLTIGGNSANSGAAAKGAAKPSMATFGARPNLLGGRMGGTTGSASRGLGSLRERRAMREQQKAAAAQAAAEKERKAAEEREKEREKERAQREEEKAAEKAEREKEREKQREELLKLQEEIRKVREQKEAEAQKEKNANDAAGGDNP